MSKSSLKAYDIIRALILSGEFPPGLHLKEEELAEKCGVSRTPIRDALRALAADDYVRVKPNHGTYVSSWSTDDIDEIFKLRATLEGMAASNAANNITQDQIMEMEKQFKIIENTLKHESTFDNNLFLTANRRFHDIINDASKSKRLGSIISRLIEQPVVVKTSLSYKMKDLRRSNAQHGEIIAAFKAKDSQWAEAIMQSHILAASQSYKHHYQETNIIKSETFNSEK